MTSTISNDVINEHLVDGQDNITEAVKTIRRVLKISSDLEPELGQATMHLKSAKELMHLAGQRLPK